MLCASNQHPMKALASTLLALFAATAIVPSILAEETTLIATEMRKVDAVMPLGLSVGAAVSAVSVDFAIDVKAAARFARLVANGSHDRSAADLAGAIYAPAGEIVRLANNGVTLRETSTSRVVLLVGRSLAKAGLNSRAGWNVRIAIDW